jgi:hypothetical protein
MLSSTEDTSRTPHGHWLLGAPLSFSAALLDLKQGAVQIIVFFVTAKLGEETMRQYIMVLLL